MQQPIELNPKDVAAIIRATFPEYRKRKVLVHAAESVMLHDLNWSGGTRKQYRAATLDGLALGNADRFNAMAPWDSRQVEGQRLPLVPGACVAECGFFCGKASTLRLYVHPSDLPRYLPAPASAAQ